ncbi:MAG: right-handed parallel beta-helix repeat-containing protein [Planctomycetes bacterium]|nr:right-handed parallel beta-helix repeat-containing protein [Planctomycetota bacterium]
MRNFSIAILAVSTWVGSDLGAATLKVPAQFGSIQAALNAANPGDTVLVKGGVYFENLTLTVANVHLKAQGKVIVDGFAGGLPHGAALFIGGPATGARVTGLTLRHARTSVALGYGLLNNASEVVLTKVTVQAAQLAGIRTEGDDVTLRQCVVEGCNGGIEAFGMDQTIEKCIVRADGVAGIRVTQKYATIRNNRVENIEDGIGIHVAADFVTLAGNRVERTYDNAAMVLSGGTIVATGNRIRAVGNDSYAALVSGTNCTLRGNRITDCVSIGLYVAAAAKETTAEKNVFERCGSENEPSVFVEGLYTHLIGNVVRFADGDGIYVASTGPTLDGNRVLSGNNDGVYVAAITTGAELRKNVVRNNLGEGFDIVSAPAVFKGNVALGNRIDFGTSVWFDTDGNTIGTFDSPDVP